MSHLGAIGIDAETDEDLQQMVEDAIGAAEPAPSLAGWQERHGWFRDTTGATLAVHWDKDGAVDCVTPFFDVADGGPRWRVRTNSAHVDKECAHCSGADCDIKLVGEGTPG